MARREDPFLDHFTVLLQFQRTRSGLQFIVMAMLVCALTSASAYAASMKVEWDVPVDPATAGYVLSYGVGSGQYPMRVDVGLVNSFRIPDLIEGTTYCVVVQAYDAQGLQSGASNEACGVARTPLPPGTVPVKAGDNLQAALDAAQPGDTILLEAGATFLGNFVLPMKAGASTEFITIRSAAPDTVLPAEGERMTPAYAAQLPKFRSPNAKPALATAPGAHHYRLQFLELGPSAKASGTIVALGDGTALQNTLESVPSDLILDRVYVHGDATRGQSRGIALNSASTQIINSYVAEIKSPNASQAIAGWNGPGPYVITNNYLEAAGPNIQIGASAPAIPQLVPSDITISANHVTKPLAWRTQSWDVRSLLELRSARRVTIDGNLFENKWASGESSFAIRLDGVSASTTLWSAVQDVDFRHNIVRNVASGLHIARASSLDPMQVSNISIANNLFDKISGALYGGSGLFLDIDGTPDVTVDHNTIFNDGASVVFARSTSPRFQFTNNIVTDRGAAIASAKKSPGLATIAKHFPNGLFTGGIYAGANPLMYPTSNYFPLTLDLAGFVSLLTGDYRLGLLSLYQNAGTDGLDPGCDIAVLPQ